ncbi:MAG: response regulator [Alphaproteobacteria bacterium]|nr:response regulator [Alphaproteobacteria bacterium]
MARILIAEDEPAVREFVTRALAQHRYQVTAVADGSLALEELRRAEYDRLLTDIVMPELDGIALALSAARDYPALRIVMMTGYAAERQRAHNLDALIHRVVPKPFSLQQICDAVAEAREND